MARATWKESPPAYVMTDPLVTLMVSRLEIGGTLAKWRLRVTIGQPPKEFLLYDYPHRKKGLHYHLAWKPTVALGTHPGRSGFSA